MAKYIFTWDGYKKCRSPGFITWAEGLFGKEISFADFLKSYLARPSGIKPSERKRTAKKVYSYFANAGLIKRPSLF